MSEQRINGRGAVLAAGSGRVGVLDGEAGWLRGGAVRRNFSWTLAGNMVSAGCQWGQLVVLAKLVRPELVGQFALAFAITAPVMLAANLGLRTVQVTDARRRFSFVDYFRLRLITVVVAMLAITGIGLLGGFSRELMALLWIVGASKGIDALADILHGAFHQAEWMAPIGKALILNGVVSLAALTFAVAVTGSVVWGAVGTAAGSAVSLLGYTVPVYRRWSGGRNPQPRGGTPQRLLQLAVLAAPLGLAYLLTSLNPNLPTYVIARVLGEGDLGIYAALAYLTVAGHMVVSAAANVALPHLATLIAQREVVRFTQVIIRLIGGAIAVGLLAVLAVWVGGGPLLRLVYRPEYAAESGVLLWLTVGMSIAFVVWILDAGLAAVHRFAVQAPINLVMVVVCAVACLLAVPRYGLDGAAWAVCLSLTVQAALKAFVLHRALRSRHAGV